MLSKKIQFGKKQMKLFCTGHEGLVGTELLERGVKPLFMDIIDPKSVEKEIKKKDPEVIIHCASMTDVEQCENMPKEAFKVNVMGVMNILNYFNGTFIYISTDHVFEGERNWSWQYSEHHKPSPVNAYGFTKFEGEAMMRTAYGKSYIVRTSKLFDYKMMKDDIELLRSGQSVEFTNLIRRSFLHVQHFVIGLIDFVVHIDTMPSVLHIAGTDTMSYAQFWDRAKLILELDGKIEYRNKEIKAAPRPFKGGLNTGKAKSLGIPLYSAIDGLYLVKEGK
jgi:dTDP-4-dehydrorhamnose reductase